MKIKTTASEKTLERYDSIMQEHSVPTSYATDGDCFRSLMEDEMDCNPDFVLTVEWLDGIMKDEVGRDGEMLEEVAQGTREVSPSVQGIFGAAGKLPPPDNRNLGGEVDTMRATIATLHLKAAPADVVRAWGRAPLPAGLEVAATFADEHGRAWVFLLGADGRVCAGRRGMVCPFADTIGAAVRLYRARLSSVGGRARSPAKAAAAAANIRKRWAARKVAAAGKS